MGNLSAIRMERAIAHGSTFGCNDLAMVAGIATLDVLASERLIENAARMGEQLLQALSAMIPRYEFLHQVRGKGLMIGIEFGPPKSLKLKASWHALETSREGLFCQLITMPLLKEHKILSQVASHTGHIVKLLPALVISAADCEYVAKAFTQTVQSFQRKRPSRKPFPDHLPRERVVIAAPDSCPCCGSAKLSKLGEDITETLEVIPRQWKVIQTVREKFSCRECEKITQPPAPFHVTPRGFAGPNLLAMILFEKFDSISR